MNLRFFTLLVFTTLFTASFSQDTAYMRSVVSQLASPALMGRGYVKQGDKKAADYLIKQLEELQVNPLIPQYKQSFSFPINTYPGAMHLSLDGKELHPVKDYVIAPNSPAVKGNFPVTYVPAGIDSLPALQDSLAQLDFSQTALVAQKSREAAVVLIPKKKIYWWLSTGQSVANTPMFYVVDSLLKNSKELEVKVSQKFVKNHESGNILAYIPGTEQPDSFVVFSAHYDHLGLMGKDNVFRGANDNASGTAMLLTLAKYFASHPPKQSVAFLFFAGEEVGLLGSLYYTQHPVFPLTQIKTLINLDMVGTGSEGLSIVNGKLHPELSAIFTQLNEKGAYFTDIRLGKESCNSDHCPFEKAGVPSLFLFTRGPEFQEYHNLLDVPEKLPLTRSEELMQLLIDFVSAN